MSDMNTLGKYYEVLFKAECLKRNIVVLSPECSHLPFDLVILDGNKFLRIQVKGTGVHIVKRRGSKGTARYYRVKVTNARGVNYRDQGIDFVAAYIDPMKTWYMVPSEYLTGRTFQVNPNGYGGRADKCRERWDFFMTGEPIQKIPVVIESDQRTLVLES